jgi:hypothetical protein
MSEINTISTIAKTQILTVGGRTEGLWSAPNVNWHDDATGRIVPGDGCIHGQLSELECWGTPSSISIARALLDGGSDGQELSL